LPRGMACGATVTGAEDVVSAQNQPMMYYCKREEVREKKISAREYEAEGSVAEIVGEEARVFGRSGVAGFLAIVITANFGHSHWLECQADE
jgi:hypothetical protein